MLVNGYLFFSLLLLYSLLKQGTNIILREKQGFLLLIFQSVAFWNYLMTKRIAINGYGRIGRCIVRALYESGLHKELRVVAINELADPASITHLTKFDSTHGTFAGTVSYDGRSLQVNGDDILLVNERDPAGLPWGELGVNIVLECSGSFTDRATAEKHLASGAGKFLFSCPAQSDVDATIVYGLNHDQLRGDERIVSNASCTSNCISHVVRLLDERFGIEHGTITTTHSMMNDQPVIDHYHHPDLRKSRSSGNSIIPVTTGLARGIGRLFPHLQGRFEAIALRVPTMNVSLMQMTAQVRRTAEVREVNEIFRHEAQSRLKGILEYTDLPLVSCDFIHNPHSAVIDSTQTSTSGALINVMVWFDNEWGYANRMLDTTRVLAGFSD